MTIKNCALCEDFKDKYWDWNLSIVKAM